MKKKVFTICPKTGRITGLNNGYNWLKLFFPLIGLFALVWYLVRVLPKPSRALYPCQKIAGPLGLSFLAYVLSWTGLVVFLRKAKKMLVQRKILVGAICLGICLMFILWNMGILPQVGFAFTPSDPPNSPIGTAKGIYPGRVVLVHDTDATLYNGSGSWWSDTNTNQEICESMLNSALLTLTGAPSSSEAWDALFRHFNGGTRGYSQEERIAIKINCNNSGSHGDTDNDIDATPQTMYAMLDQLVNSAGVPQNMITVYDASRAIPDMIYNKCNSEFPEVLWMDSRGGNGRQRVVWQQVISYSVSNDCGSNVPSTVVEATYLINLALLKGHGIAGVTLTAKNHYGTVSDQDHDYIRSSSRPYGTYNPLVDIIGQQHLGGKTMLYLIDGLYGTRRQGSSVSDDNAARWDNMFSGDYSSLYLLSQDPVAIDSVALDFLNAEFGNDSSMNRADNYLHEAAQADNPPSGTNYTPNGDGVRLSSLGVHEHWNNPQSMQYTRNLGTGNGIELINVAGYVTPVPTQPGETPSPTPTPVPTPTPLKPGTTYELQAEEAQYSSGSVETNHDGYTGTGFVNTDNSAGEWIEWSIEVEVASDATCVFRYACESDARPMDLSINGSVVTNLGFPASGGWAAWTTETADVILDAGSNTIRLTAIESGGAPNMDKMDLTIYEGEDPTPTPLSTDPGDVNNDGSINILDALLVAQCYVGITECPLVEIGDTNCDGSVDIIDALLIAQFYVGLIDQFCQ